MCDSCSFTSARSQILILSSACFALPGMFNALNSLSPPGLSNEHLKANANSLLYALFTISGLIAGGLQNKYGPRPLLCVGGATYVLVAGSYVAISKFGDDAAAFALTASSLLGVGAGLLWAAQGAMILSYPIESKKGSYFGMYVKQEFFFLKK